MQSIAMYEMATVAIAEVRDFILSAPSSEKEISPYSTEPRPVLQASSGFQHLADKLKIGGMFIQELTKRYRRRAKDEAKKIKELEKKFTFLATQRDNAVAARRKAEENMKSLQEKAKAAAEIHAQEKGTLELKLKAEVERRKELEAKLAETEGMVSFVGDAAVKAFKESDEMTEILLNYVEPIDNMGYARGRVEGQLDLRRRVKRRYPGDKCFLLDLLDAPLSTFWQQRGLEPLLLQIAETLNHRSLATELDVDEGSLDEDRTDLKTLAPAYPLGLPASSSIHLPSNGRVGSSI